MTLLFNLIPRLSIKSLVDELNVNCTHPAYLLSRELSNYSLDWLQ